MKKKNSMSKRRAHVAVGSDALVRLDLMRNGKYIRPVEAVNQLLCVRNIVGVSAVEIMEQIRAVTPARKTSPKKCAKIAVRPLRKLCPVLPSDAGDETFLLLRADARGHVVETKLFANHVECTRTGVSGFTHWARLPGWLKPNNRNLPADE